MDNQDNIGIRDSANVMVLKNNGRKMIKSNQSIIGVTSITLVKKSGKIIKVLENKRNTISSILLDNLADAIVSHNNNMGIDSLFDTDNQLFGGSPGGTDGIICVDDGDAGRSCITEVKSPTNTYGRKWQGSIRFTAAHTINKAYIGAGRRDEGSLPAPSGSGTYFTFPYANQTFTNQAVQDDDRMIFDWEIYIP